MEDALMTVKHTILFIMHFIHIKLSIHKYIIFFTTIHRNHVTLQALQQLFYLSLQWPYEKK